MNGRSMTATLAMSLLPAIPCVGAAQNGIVEHEFPCTETDSIACLGEEVEFNVTVTIREHSIQTQNGGFHDVQNWFIEGTAVGLSSGWTWFGRAASPGSGTSPGCS